MKTKTMRELRISNTITQRTPTLKKYLLEVQKQKMISPEEEVELAKRIKTGDKKALEKLVNSNLRFVVSVANQYSSYNDSGLTFLDLINEGNIGLIKAAKRFDETLGFKFISYAVWWIRQSILEAIAKQSDMIRIPVKTFGLMNRIRKGTSYLEQKFDRKPTDEEISEYLDIPIYTIEDLSTINTKHISLDTKISEEDDDTILNFLVDEDSPKPDENVMIGSLINDVHRVMVKLPYKERDVIEMLYGIGRSRNHTLEEIGYKYNINKNRVAQIRDNAIRRMKYNKSGMRLLESYC